VAATHTGKGRKLHMTSDDSEIRFNCPNCAGVLEMNGRREEYSECGKRLLVNGDIYCFVGSAANDTEHLAFVDSFVDIVCAYAMAHHLPNLDQIFREGII
jgi:hypothetical protein